MRLKKRQFWAEKSSSWLVHRYLKVQICTGIPDRRHIIVYPAAFHLYSLWCNLWRLLNSRILIGAPPRLNVFCLIKATESNIHWQSESSERWGCYCARLLTHLWNKLNNAEAHAALSSVAERSVVCSVSPVNTVNMSQCTAPTLLPSATSQLLSVSQTEASSGRGPFTLSSGAPLKLQMTKRREASKTPQQIWSEWTVESLEERVTTTCSRCIWCFPFGSSPACTGGSLLCSVCKPNNFLC